jgi:hypothetical protein
MLIILQEKIFSYFLHFKWNPIPLDFVLACIFGQISLASNWQEECENSTLA